MAWKEQLRIKTERLPRTNTAGPGDLLKGPFQPSASHGSKDVPCTSDATRLGVLRLTNKCFTDWKLVGNVLRLQNSTEINHTYLWLITEQFHCR